MLSYEFTHLNIQIEILVYVGLVNFFQFYPL